MDVTACKQWDAWLMQTMSDWVTPNACLCDCLDTLTHALEQGLLLWIERSPADPSTYPPVQIFVPADLPLDQWREVLQPSPTSSPDPAIAHYDAAHLPPTLDDAVQRTGSLAVHLPDGDLAVYLRFPPAPGRELVAIGLFLPAWAAKPGDGSVPEVSLEEERSLLSRLQSIYLAYQAVVQTAQLRQARQGTALLGRLNQLLNSRLSPDDIVDRILAEVGQAMGCDRLLLLDFRHGESAPLSSWQTPTAPPILPPMHPGLWSDCIDRVENGGASYLQLTSSPDDPSPMSQWLNDAQMASMVVMPVVVQEEFFGAIALLSAQPTAPYSVDALQLLRHVSHQVAIALTHTQQYLGGRPDVQLAHPPQTPGNLQDDLTHLMTRASLERELAHLSNRALWLVCPPFSLVVCDLDYFKLVNDAHGHGVGDEVLRLIAQRLHKLLRQGTPLYRYGGEEFVVLLPETDLSDGIKVAERLRWGISSTPLKTSAGAMTVTASFGVAQQHPDRDRSAMDVLDRANEAIAQAKRQGRNCVIGHQPEPVSSP